MTAPQIIDADARHDPASDPSYERARAKAQRLLADPTLYEWVEVPGSSILIDLRLRSLNTGGWVTHRLREMPLATTTGGTMSVAECSCEARGVCYHALALEIVGGIRRVLGQCIYCGAKIGAGWDVCAACSCKANS